MRFEIVQGDASLESHAGLSLIGQLLLRTALRERLDAIDLPGCRRPEISHGENALAMIGLLALGKPDFEAVEPFRQDEFFGLALGLNSVPSSPTLRQRLEMVEGRFDKSILEESADLLRNVGATVTPCHNKHVALDLDISPFDNSGTKKEGVGWTYKKVVGYAPAFAYLGEEGYLVNAQLREGSAHSQKEMGGFLRDAVHYARRVTKAPLLVRMDSGNDSVENIVVCKDEKADWLIKRNLRRESPESWLEIAMANGDPDRPRAGKEVWCGETWLDREDVDGSLRAVYQVTRRTIRANGQTLLVPEVEAETWWSSLPVSPKRIVELYHAHGTSEQFHSELKTDMKLERLPSGKFRANALVLLLGLMAYNLLRLIGQESLRSGAAPIRKKVFRRRLDSVIKDLMYVACRLVRHARRCKLVFGCGSAWFPVWRGAYRRFAVS